ncbi:MAG: PA14 domain-containing protein [Janthinobacterium lividum]
MQTRFIRFFSIFSLLAFCRIGSSFAQVAPKVGEAAVGIASITENTLTGQDYSPWLDDDLHHLVQNCWLPTNFQYVDVTLKLKRTVVLNRLSLFDFEGIFTAMPATIYAQNGSQRTLIGTFTGEKYYQYVNLVAAGSITADAIVIRKYSNNIPVKVKVFERVSATAQAVAPVISFKPLPDRKLGDAPFVLTATSTNTTTPITFSSSVRSAVSVSLVSGQWLATVVGTGTTMITASQEASPTYLAGYADQSQLILETETSASSKIPIDPTRWYGLSNASNNIQALFDGSISTGSVTGWGKVIPSYDAYYTLQPGEAMSIESIRFYDGGSNNMGNPMTLSIITDKWERIPIATYSGGHNYRWVGFDPNNLYNFQLSSPVSNIRALVITATWGYPTEIELRGSYVAGTPVPTADPIALALKKQVKLGQEMGVNAFEWDFEAPTAPSEIDEMRLEGIKNFTGIRHYLDWGKLESEEGSFTYNPVHSGGWNYDAMYQRCKAEGLEVLACLKTVPNWMLADYPSSERDAENVPVRYGRDFGTPASYIEQARLGFQYAARYGYNPNVSPALLHVNSTTRWTGDPANQVKIGLGYIKYIECDNERDKWWKGRKAYQTGREYAANLSAFYDGHQNTMGPGVGVKNADPNMKVVMGGIAAPTPDYVRGMVDWCRQYRGYKADGSVNVCWDVINYHLYSNDAGTSQNGNSMRGAAPEMAEAAQVAQDFVRVAHQYLGDMPVWITETGYDTNQGSPLKAIAVGTKSVLQTQADWILRTALLYARWGVERTFMYQMSDDNPDNPIQFSSSGLVNTDHSPKPAADFLRQTAQLFGNFAYKGTLNNDPIVDRYEAAGRTAYALVVPDEKGRTAAYSLSLSGVDSVTICQPVSGQQSMRFTRARVQNGRLALTVTETPMFVLVGQAPVTAPAPVGVCPGAGSIQWEQWTNVSGSDVASIPTQTTPNVTATLTKLESGSNLGDAYGARIRGYICPPQNGAYQFRISGDDDCQLWLSTDDDPAHKVLLASVTGWTAFRQWDKFTSQQSATIQLLAGHRYYVEVLHKEKDGGDNVSVAWTLPDGIDEIPIPGYRLIPFDVAKSTLQPGLTPASATSVGASSAVAEPQLLVYPNPLTSQTTVEFSLPVAGTATLSVYNTSNQLVQRLFSGAAAAGTPQQLALSGAGLAPGWYLVQLLTDTKVITQKLLKTD